MLGDMLMDKSILLPNVGNACRSLFGPVDHDEMRQTLRKERRVLDERCRERWNFDFVRELPLPGRWQYEPVTEVPAAYGMPHLSLTVKLVPAPASVTAPSRCDAAAAAAAESIGVRVSAAGVAGGEAGATPAPARLQPLAPLAEKTGLEEEEVMAMVGSGSASGSNIQQPADVATSRLTQEDLPSVVVALAPHSSTTTATQTSPQKRKRQSAITDFFTHKKARTTPVGATKLSSS